MNRPALSIRPNPNCSTETADWPKRAQLPIRSGKPAGKGSDTASRLKPTAVGGIHYRFGLMAGTASLSDARSFTSPSGHWYLHKGERKCLRLYLFECAYVGVARFKGIQDREQYHETGQQRRRRRLQTVLHLPPT